MDGSGVSAMVPPPRTGFHVVLVLPPTKNAAIRRSSALALLEAEWQNFLRSKRKKSPKARAQDKKFRIILPLRKS
jgi:hypothetical protein